MQQNVAFNERLSVKSAGSNEKKKSRNVKRLKLDGSKRETAVDLNHVGGPGLDHDVADPEIAGAAHEAVLVTAVAAHVPVAVTIADVAPDLAAVIAAGGQDPGQGNALGGQGREIVIGRDVLAHARKGLTDLLQESAAAQRKKSPLKNYYLQL